MVSQKVRRNYWNCSFIWIFTLYCPGVSLKIFTFFVLTYVEVQLPQLAMSLSSSIVVLLLS